MDSSVRPAETKREAILRAASAVFARYGYDVASMDGVAEEAGVSKRTVYNYFVSKDALFVTVINDLLVQQQSKRQIVFDPGRPLEDQVAEFVDAQAYLVTAPERLELSRACMSVLLHKPELALQVQTEASTRENHLLVWIQAARDQGRLHVEDAGLAAQMLTALMEGAINHPSLFLGSPTPEHLGALRGEIVRTFLARYGVSS